MKVNTNHFFSLLFDSLDLDCLFAFGIGLDEDIDIAGSFVKK